MWIGSDSTTYNLIGFVQIDDIRGDPQVAFDLDFTASLSNVTPGINGKELFSNLTLAEIPSDTCLSSQLTQNLLPEEPLSSENDAVVDNLNGPPIEVFRFGQLLASIEAGSNNGYFDTLLEGVDTIPNNLNLGVRFPGAEFPAFNITNFPGLSPLQLQGAPELPLVMGASAITWESEGSSDGYISLIAFPSFSLIEEAVICRIRDDGFFELPVGLREDLISSGLSVEISFAVLSRVQPLLIEDEFPSTTDLDRFSLAPWISQYLQRIIDVLNLNLDQEHDWELSTMKNKNINSYTQIVIFIHLYLWQF